MRHGHRHRHLRPAPPVANCQPGCGAGQTCNNGVCQATGACTPQNCTGPGMGCYDLETGATTGNTVCTCLPEGWDSTGQGPDTCSAYGKICDIDSSNPVPTQCRLPSDKESCTTATGCDSPQLQCTNVNGNYRCMRPCTTAMNCPSLMDFCVPNDPTNYGGYAGKCWYNICAVPDGATNPAAERALYFQPCGVATPGTGSDGVCYPLLTVNDAGTAYTDIGVCMMNGTAPAGGECDPLADKTNLPKVCGANNDCDAVMGNGAGGYRGICRPVCNAAATPSPAKSCGATQNCRDLSGFPWSSNNSNIDEMRNARLGICEPKCTMFGSDTCSPDALGNATGCFPMVPFDGKGYCRALMPGAKGAGQTCSTPAGEIRNACGDRLLCDEGASGVCIGFCNTATCYDSTQVCASCQPSGYKCLGLLQSPPQPAVGLCQP